MSGQPQPRKVPIIRYMLDGKAVPKGTPGSKRRRSKSSTYYATIHRKRYALGTADLGEAWVALKALQRQLGNEEAGIVDSYVEQVRRPLEDHIIEWLESLRHRGTTESQVELMGARLRLLAQLAGWKRVADLTASSLLAALSRLITEPGLASRWSVHGRLNKIKGTVSLQTRNHYLSHAKQFARWCCEIAPRRLREHPFLGLRPVSVESDRRHDRRAPTDEEVRLLFTSLATAPERSGMNGPQRALGYKVAMATGFRAGELRSLSRESFDLNEGTVTVRAAYSKRRRRDTQQLPAWLISELREWFAADGKTWEGFPKKHPGIVLMEDLERAGVAYQTAGPDGPLFFDFHALRHFFCTAIANQPGISLKTLLTLTRHSTPDLALKTYAKARQADLKAAVDQIPDPGR